MQYISFSTILFKFTLLLKLMRLHKPTGIWLLLWPCWWSIALASNSATPDLYLLAVFALGAIVMRGLGCVINDIIDRDVDSQVERTKNRPLANGDLSLTAAYWLIFILAVVGITILINLNTLAIMLGLIIVFPIIIYPYMKRIMAWPQVFLALIFNFGALMGWAAVTNDVDIPALSLYAAGIFWTLGYDTIYAHQDRKSDEKIGIKSTAVSMQEKTKAYVSIFYLAMIVFLLIAGTSVFSYHNVVYYFSLILALGHLLWQIKTVDLDNPKDCMKKFKSNTVLGWIVFLGIIFENMLTYL